MNIGVSPAYFISKYSSHFTLENYVESIPVLKEMGFNNLQLEIFHYEQLREWNFINCRELVLTLQKNQMRVSQFVAHFMMPLFSTKSSLKNGEFLSELEFLCIMLRYFEYTGVVTIPLGKFQDRRDLETTILYTEVMQKIELMAIKYEMDFALEPQPESLAADLSYLEDFPLLGLNLDPGHLLCSGIDPFELDSDILSRVKATHLCENDGITNRSDRPGTWNYNWSKLLDNLQQSGYRGSYDIEIICDREDVHELYSEARFFLTENCIQNNTYIKERINE